MNEVQAMNMANKIMIALFFIAASSIAGATAEEFWMNAQDMRLYQTESSPDEDGESDQEERDSTGTPTELILDTEPEC